MNAAYWLNTLWTLKCRREAQRFQAATRSVRSTQAELLRRILARNQNCDYGKTHHFSRIGDPRDFQRQVPLSTYRDYRDAIAQISTGKPNVLTHQRVRLLEPTSGSTSGEKLIPYTRDLQHQFQRAIDTWIHDLMTCRPLIRGGRAYWSISPSLSSARTTTGGIPIGFDDDVAYLSRWEQLAVRHLLVVPSTVAKLPDMDNFRYATLLHLLRASDLTLISIWSPTFLAALFESLESWVDSLCHDLRYGTITWPVSHIHRKPLREVLRGAGRTSNAQRAKELQAAWETAASMSEFFAHIWPNLQLISCWGDAAASQYLSQLQAFFPAVEIQPKGLLATEACMSVPLCDRPGAGLAIRSHFFEFHECDPTRNTVSDQTYLAHELERGRSYRIVVTTGGGLYRYQLGDLIEVVGFENQCPLIRFLGRFDKVADLVGEKLAEAHVRDVLQRAFKACQLNPTFAMLVPRSKPAGYQLLLETSSQAPNSETVDRLRVHIESGLMENPYYRHAVEIKQLAPLVVALPEPSAPSYWKMYEQACLARGQKAGDIKPTVLAPTDWHTAATNLRR